MGQGKLPVRFKRNISNSDAKALSGDSSVNGKIIFASDGGLLLGNSNGTVSEVASLVTASDNGYININGVQTQVFAHDASKTAVDPAAVKVGYDVQGHVVLGAALTADDITNAVSYAYLTTWTGSDSLTTAAVGTLATAATKAYTETVSAGGTGLPTAAAVATYVASYVATQPGVSYTGTVTGIKLDGTNTVSVAGPAGGVADLSDFMAAKANVADTVNDVQYDGTNKKITKTVGETESDVVTASQLLEDANGTTYEYVNDELAKKADLAGATFTGVVTFETTAYSYATLAATTDDEQVATTAFVQDAIDAKIAANDAMHFRGIVDSDNNLPTTAYNGDTYKVAAAGKYNGVQCEVGDMFIASVSGTTGGSPSWSVIQTNIDGAVTGPASAANAHIAVFDGTTGKVIKDSGFTIEKSVPSTAAFTDRQTYITYTGTGNAITEITYTAETTSDGVTKVTYTLTKGATFADASYTYTALNTKADLASPTFTGTPTAPTVGITGTDQTNLATNGAVYSYVGGAIANMQVKSNMVDEVSFDSKATDKYPSAYAVYNAIEDAVDAAETSINALKGRIDNIDSYNFISENAFTAKGQLLVGTGSGSYTALAVGTTGYVLSANSSATNGVEWKRIAVTDYYHNTISGTLDNANGTYTFTLSDTQTDSTAPVLSATIPAAVSNIALGSCYAGLMTAAEANNLAICVDALTWEDED